MTEFLIKVLDNGITVTNLTLGDTHENKVYENNHFQEALMDIYQRINPNWAGEIVRIVWPYTGSSGMSEERRKQLEEARLSNRTKEE